MIFMKLSFSWPVLWSFLIGIFLGCVLMALIYAYMCLVSMKKNNHVDITGSDDLEKKTLDKIEEAKEKFKDKDLRGNTNVYKHLGNVCIDLVNDVALGFYPDSKYPMYELSIDEILQLAKYISDRLNELLDRKGIRMVKKLKISKILEMIEMKKKADTNKVIKAVKQVNPVWKVVKTVLNYANPIYWTKKLVVSKTVDFMMGKICLIAISIVGEETYKVYSKKAFQTVLELDSGTGSLLKEIDDSTENLSEQELLEVEKSVSEQLNDPNEQQEIDERDLSIMLPYPETEKEENIDEPIQKETKRRGWFRKKI